MIRRWLAQHSNPFPAAILVGVLSLALVLLAIGARSPYTQANLNWSYDRGYTRTEQTFVGAPVPYQGGKLAIPPSTDPVARGQQLFVVKGCASCHGLAGRDGIIAPVIVGTDVDALHKKTQKGPGGMPAYAPGSLSDDDLADIAVYLKAMGKP